MSKVMRSVKNVTKGYSSVQVKVREATSNDAWGPTGTQMSEIAQLTYNTGSDFVDIMEMLDRRLNDKGKNWRHVLKALKVLDYCLHEGSEMVVSWARQNIYIVKTLREFQYVDEDGRDVGQNVRVAAKELTALILDEERLRAERSDRRSWKSRVTGLEEYAPNHADGQRRTRERPTRGYSDDEDAEYKLAIEASKHQEEEDRRKRQSRTNVEEDDDDLAKAIKLSKEEEERRRRELEGGNASSAAIFDDDLIQMSQPQSGTFNLGYQQGNPVDFFANPIEQSQLPAQQTSYMPTAYTGFPTHPAAFHNTFSNGYSMQQNAADPYGQQQPAFHPPSASYNPYTAPQVQSPLPEPVIPPGSNNPWATKNSLGSVMPTPTGSNNPFASSFGSPQAIVAPTNTPLSSLPEQKALSAFPAPAQVPFSQPQSSFTVPQKELNEHEAKLNALLASGDGMDTFGNTGNLRIPAQHTAPGTFVNSAGAGLNRLGPEQTGNNPFLRTQFTGLPNVTYQTGQIPRATGSAGVNGSNPFTGNRPRNAQPQDLIQF